MKKQIWNRTGLILATTLLALSVGAMASAEERVVATVPFAFVVGHSRLPAGEYVIKAASDGLDVWAITSEDGHHSTLVTTIAAPSSRVQTPELVFDRFANQYFLSRIVVDGSDQREIPLTPARMEHEVVTLALKN